MRTRLYDVHDAPDGAIYCGRAGRGTRLGGDFSGDVGAGVRELAAAGYFGNPHRVGLCWQCSMRAGGKVLHTKGEAVELFRRDFLAAVDPDSDAFDGHYRRSVEQLRNRALACHCGYEAASCHVRVIVEWLDRKEGVS